MNGIIKKRIFIIIGIIIAAVITAAIFCTLYFSGLFLPDWAVWHDVTIDINNNEYIIDGTNHIFSEEPLPGNDEPDIIELKHRRVKAYRDGKCIFKSPRGCLVQNIIYTDIDRDGENELLMLNFNIGRYGKHRPFWVDHDELKLFQHIYIYDYKTKEEIFRPIWMASDIGMDASDFYMQDSDKQVVGLIDKNGNRSNWMWLSFGLRCVD